MSISLPGNNILKISSTVDLHFKLNKFSWTQTFCIVDNLPFDCLIGSKTLKHCNIVLDFANSDIKFKHDENITIPFLNSTSAGNIISTITEARIFMDKSQNGKLNALLRQYDVIFSEIPGRAKNFEYRIK